MIIIRPIAKKDTEAFTKIAFAAGIGMTSMPKNLQSLEKRVSDSERAFANKCTALNLGTYLFVLEDLETGIIEGTCGITPKTGVVSPLSFYKIDKQEKHATEDDGLKTVPVLKIVHYSNYSSEICSLFLSKDYRHSGLGRLLSLSRFLFIAAYPERFDHKIFAEMRGHTDEKGISLYWEGIGRHFFDTPYKTLMELKDKGRIDLTTALPFHPIYIELLPQDVQDSIGKVHEDTQTALKMLTEEGFQVTNEVDVFDGGPKIEVETKTIRSVRESVVEKIAEITEELLEKPDFIISNNRIDFRACLSPLHKNPKGELIVPKKVANALHLRIGDTIRYVSPYKEKHI